MDRISGDLPTSRQILNLEKYYDCISQDIEEDHLIERKLLGYNK
jgi:hypothetical protein